MIIKKLPHWVISNPNPSFFETEGGTVLEQTGVMYKKVQELIDSYNGIVDEINNEIDEFITNGTSNQEEFEIKINQMIHDFTTLVETELKSQDAEIKNATEYMTTYIEENIGELLKEIVESGEVELKLIYNENSESLEIVGAVLGGSE